jgi:hypothetical protein
VRGRGFVPEPCFVFRGQAVFMYERYVLSIPLASSFDEVN